MTTSPASSSSSPGAQKLHVDFKKPHTTPPIKKQVNRLLRQASELSEQGKRSEALQVTAKALKLDNNNKLAKQLFFLICSAMHQNAKSREGKK